MHPVERQLATICGPGFARAAGAADTAAGAQARWVAAPGTVAGLVAVVRAAAAHDLTMVPRAAGTKLDWGVAPSRVDLLVDTGRLAGLWHHVAGQRTAQVGAGTPLRAAQARLARAGQRLALDPPSTDATVGGVLAADEAGPLAYRHGGPADQVVGVSYVRADGSLVETSDPTSARVLCGSYGALALLASITLRVVPLPATRLWVSRPVWTPLEVHDLVDELLSAGLTPAALEVDLPATANGVRVPLHAVADAPADAPAGPAPNPGPGFDAGRRTRGHPAGTGRVARGPGTLAVLFEGPTIVVEEQAVIARSLLGPDARRLSTPPRWWRRYPFGPDDVALRLAAPRADLHAAVYALRDAAGVAVPVRGSVGLGVVHAALPGTTAPAQVSAILGAVRGVLIGRGGSCRVLSAPPAVRAGVDLWGGLLDRPRRRQLKERFDPAGRLSPGRYPGGG